LPSPRTREVLTWRIWRSTSAIFDDRLDTDEQAIQVGENLEVREVEEFPLLYDAFVVLSVWKRLEARSVAKRPGWLVCLAGAPA